MSTNENEPANKAEFLEQLQQSWAELEQTLNGYSDEQMTQREDAVGWTVKDHLGHLISWEEGITALLQKQPRWEAMGLDPDLVRRRSEDEINQVMREQMQPLSLEEVRSRLSAANAALTSVVQSLAAEDLLKSYSHFQPDESGKGSPAPILGWVDGNSNAHYREHLPWIKEIAEDGD
jgi:hypothetical protein